MEDSKSDGGGAFAAASLKKRPFESPEEEQTFFAHSRWGKFQIRFKGFFREFGLTSSCNTIPVHSQGVRETAAEPRVADRLISAVPAITGLIDRLEAMDLITRDRSTDDRRVVHGDRPQRL